TTDAPIVAANESSKFARVVQPFERQKNLLIRKLEEAGKKTQNHLDKTMTKLLELEEETSPSQLADIIMAHLHQIPRGAERADLFDFYRNEPIEIKLKRGISPQKHAENLYRKAKNRKIEIQQLQKNVEDKENY